MDFNVIKTAVAKKFEAMSKQPLLRTGVEKDTLWETYLGSFTPENNPIFKERTEHDCKCCMSFIRAVGNVVVVVNNELVSIWDVTVSEPGYQKVCDAMSTLVKSKLITDKFLHFEGAAGTEKSFIDTLNGVKSWSHFYVRLPNAYVKKEADIPSTLSVIRSTHDVMARGLDTITDDAVNTVLDLVSQKSLYRGEEHKATLLAFQKLKAQYTALSDSAKDPFVWSIVENTPGPVAKIRNTSIGTLLNDLSEGEDLEAAVKKFESVVAPANYKRPTALVTKGMIEKAKATVLELGLSSALERRFAVLEDITVNNVLYANRSARKSMEADVFDSLASKVATNVKTFDKVEEVPLERFLSDILPRAESLEIMLENRHQTNLVSLIAPADPTAAQLFKWDNKFSWSYNGNVADSLREKVAAAGGRVDGVLRFSHSWNHEGRNASLMDLHVFMPGSGPHADGCHARYPTGQRVGWNCREDRVSGGIQDVDYTDAAPEGYVPVENITFPTLSKLRDGKYVFKIHNWSLRQPTTSGFKAEIEFEGQVFEYNHPQPLRGTEWITVAEATLKNGRFSIDHKLPHGASVRKVWNLDTCNFHKVNVVMMSPNFWDGQGVGNKHTFFMLEGCLNDSNARGFFNEFLKEELSPHRKVIELIGARMTTEKADRQLSGLGFSSTQRNNVLCRVKGSVSRVVNIIF